MKDSTFDLGLSNLLVYVLSPFQRPRFVSSLAFEVCCNVVFAIRFFYFRFVIYIYRSFYIRYFHFHCFTTSKHSIEVERSRPTPMLYIRDTNDKFELSKYKLNYRTLA